MNKHKITSKPYRIIRNAFVGVEQGIIAYTVFSKSIYSIEQCLKRTYKNNKFIKVIKVKKNFSLKRVC